MTFAKKFLTFIALVLLCLTFTLSGCNDTTDDKTDDGENLLINPNADENAKELMRYLKSIYGKYVLSGQYVNMYEDFNLPQFRVDENDPESQRTVFKANELQAVKSVTGDYPAMLGLDISGLECGGRCFSI